MEQNHNNSVTKPKAPRNKLGHLVLTIGVAAPVKFVKPIRVLSAEEMNSINKRNK